MSKKLVIGLVALGALLLVAQVGTLAFLFLRPSVAGATAADHAAPVAEGPKVEGGGAAIDPAAAFILPLPKFVTDLADKEKPHYVDVTIALAMKDQKTLDEAKKITPAIRDEILGLLRTKAAADLAGAQGKEKLAEAINNQLKTVLGGNFKKVFVTDLITQ